MRCAERSARKEEKIGEIGEKIERKIEKSEEMLSMKKK